MGDRKPKKNSSGNSDAHKAKQKKTIVSQAPDPRTTDKSKGEKK